MDPETLVLALLSIRERAGSEEEAKAAAEWLAAQLEAPGED